MGALRSHPVLGTDSGPKVFQVHTIISCSQQPCIVLPHFMVGI